MDRAPSSQEGKGLSSKYRPKLKRCSSLKLPGVSRKKNPFSVLKFLVLKSFKNLSGRANELGDKGFYFSGMVINNSLYMASPCSFDDKMEPFPESAKELVDAKYGDSEIKDAAQPSVDVNKERFGETSGSSSNLLASEITVEDEHSICEDSSSSPPSMDWPLQENEIPPCVSSRDSEEVEKPLLDNRKLEKQGSSLSEVEMMKERFAKLLLGEDMSGCGNGVSTALAISNAITNLCATIFGQIWRLEPLPPEKKFMWRREMEWLLSVSDHIVELIPCLQTFPDGSKLEIMTSRPRSDLYVNLPALRKLDNMLLEILDSFEYTEFWYVDQGITTTEDGGSSSFQKLLPRQEDKWWLPLPRVPVAGLSEEARKGLNHRHDCTGQILKAAMAINSITLADMEVPESYLESLPKNAKSSLGELIYRYISSDQFSPECLLECLDLSSEHQALDLANRVEATICMWRRKNYSKTLSSTKRSSSKSSWDIVKDLVTDTDRRELLADRAESLMLSLKQRFPGLSQTTLDTSKIQYNKDVGKSILESYSRVLESLAFNIVARIDDLLYVDDLTKHSDQPLAMSKVGTISHKSVIVVPVSGTPYKTAFTTPSFSPLQRASPAIVESSAINRTSNSSRRGYSVKKVLTDYLSIQAKGKESSSPVRRRSDSVCSLSRESTASQSVESYAATPLVESYTGSPSHESLGEE